MIRIINDKDYKLLTKIMVIPWQKFYRRKRIKNWDERLIFKWLRL